MPWPRRGASRCRCCTSRATTTTASPRMPGSSTRRPRRPTRHSSSFQGPSTACSSSRAPAERGRWSRPSSRRTDLVEVFADQPEEDAVDPLSVAQVGPALYTFSHEADPLGVRDRPLVEAVDLELQAVVVEIEDEVAL